MLPESNSGKNSFFSSLKIDWVMFFCAIIISFLGLITMSSFVSTDVFVEKQIIWLIISIIIFFILSSIDYRFLNKTNVVMSMFVVSIILLLALTILGHTVKGAESWFKIGDRKSVV